jgi:hypothetical protein
MGNLVESDSNFRKIGYALFTKHLIFDIIFACFMIYISNYTEVSLSDIAETDRDGYRKATTFFITPFLVDLTGMYGMYKVSFKKLFGLFVNLFFFHISEQ